MPESTSTSDSRRTPFHSVAVLGALCCLTLGSIAHAEDGFGTTATPGRSDEEDYSTTPYTEYGEFNEDEDEAANTQYLQYGRFFGVSVGLGTHGATGNRGALWNGGFPALDFKLHYWFNFNFALQMGFYTAPHYFTTSGVTTNVTFSRIGVDLKYYFDTRDLSSALTFIGPHILVGVGNYSKAQTNTQTNVTDNDSAVGLSFGGGLEITVSPKKVYAFFQMTYDLVSFKDANTQIYQATNNLSDMSGSFYSYTGGLMFTW